MYLGVYVRVAIRKPRVSGTGDAQCTSPHRTLLSNCVVQRMRAWSLAALLFLSEPVCRSVGRSAARGTRPRRESDPSPPTQAPESPYFPRFEAELGEMR